MDENAEEQQVQRDRGRSVLWIATGRCDWFADGVDAGFSLQGMGVSLKQDSSRAFTGYVRRVD